MADFSVNSLAFQTYLINAAADGSLTPDRHGSRENGRYIPRNFLLDERLEASRLQSYGGFLPAAGPTTFTEWDTAHKRYLETCVFATPPPTSDMSLLDVSDPAACPETFRAASGLVELEAVDLNTYLIRMVSVEDLATMARTPADTLFELGERVSSSGQRGTPDEQKLSDLLEEAYLGDRCDRRPVFAAFYEDLQDDLAKPDWANRLRDRLGLYHLNEGQRGGLPRRVFLFWYRVRELPRRPGRTSTRPLAVPSVLDHRMNEAFCPAPAALDRGRLVNLSESDTELPARELLHPFLPLEASHLLRVGKVTTPVPADLAPARRNHLILVRMLAQQDDFAANTDADLL